MTPTGRPFLESPLKLLLVGGLLLLAAAAVLASVERQSLLAELEQESTILHRLTSQRADQHDAHLTALSAIAVAAQGERHDLFLDVAATISRFYPRIDEVQLVPLDPPSGIVGTEPLAPALAETIRAAAQTSTGDIALLPHPDKAGHYIMVKRSPNSDAAQDGLMLSIDAETLLGDADEFWSRASIALALSMPDGQPLYNRGDIAGTLQFSRILSSASQPLRLETGMRISLADLLPPLATALTLAAVALAYFVALWALRQRRRTQQAVEQARLSALDSRLAHASRVNALGEMASGLAHELTQPLTAILAQIQAGRRLLEQGDAATLAPVLDDTVTQARRASAILERFRNWSRPQQAPRSAFDLRDALKTVETLLGPQAASHGVALVFDLPAQPARILADPVEMEQVVFNLVRNAIDATANEGAAGRVTVTLRQREDDVLLDISDNGPGIPPDLRPRLFIPFTTTRADGTGLGLALSQRLVERAGGEIALVDTEAGATFRVVLPRQRTAEGAQ